MFVIQILGLQGTQANGQPPPPPGCYIASADVDAMGGLGEVVITLDPEQAVKFDTAFDAMDYWRQPSVVRPYLDNGQVNRPLTAYTVEVSPL